MVGYIGGEFLLESLWGRLSLIVWVLFGGDVSCDRLEEAIGGDCVCAGCVQGDMRGDVVGIQVREDEMVVCPYAIVFVD